MLLLLMEVFSCNNVSGVSLYDGMLLEHGRDLVFRILQMLRNSGNLLL